MPKFTAKKIDLDLELTTLSGEVVELSGPVLSGAQAGAIYEKMDNEDNEFNKRPQEERTPFAVARLYAEQLTQLYDMSDASWWLENLDAGTITEIKVFVGATLLGVKKKED